MLEISKTGWWISTRTLSLEELLSELIKRGSLHCLPTVDQFFHVFENTAHPGLTVCPQFALRDTDWWRHRVMR